MKQQHEIWIEELAAAGWTAARPTFWRSPDGEFFLGPAGAWREMKRRAADASHKWIPEPGIGERCELCGIVRRRDKSNSPCKGKVAISVRDA